MHTFQSRVRATTSARGAGTSYTSTRCHSASICPRRRVSNADQGFPLCSALTTTQPFVFCGVLRRKRTLCTRNDIRRTRVFSHTRLSMRRGCAHLSVLPDSSPGFLDLALARHAASMQHELATVGTTRSKTARVAAQLKTTGMRETRTSETYRGIQLVSRI